MTILGAALDEPAGRMTMALIMLIATAAVAHAAGSEILRSDFNRDAGGFVCLDDLFRGTAQPAYASGARVASGGFKGGALRVALGGGNDLTITRMSGGWRNTFTLAAASRAVLTFRYKLTQTSAYESDEVSQALVSVDGALRGVPPGDYVAQIAGDGTGGSARTTGWKVFQADLGTLAAGDHTLAIGAYKNKKTLANESTEMLIDDVLVMDPSAGASLAVGTLSLERFKDNIRVLASFGDRTQGSQSNINAGNWLQAQLEAAGYQVVRHAYTYSGQARQNIYATKVGTTYPDQMYIVSAHFDGRGGGGAADDDASGCSLVLEVARALAAPGLQTHSSVRFIFWNNEETGLNGSTAYVNDRSSLRGVESPAGSGLYPEPDWLGMIQHDMILYDHGLPPQPNQIPEADLDVEYQASSTFASQSLALANAFKAGNARYSATYPAQVGNNMSNTDSHPFRNLTAAISVRENQRLAEIGKGSNPNYHQASDLFTSYSDADFQLGLNAAQMTLGTVAELSGARLD